MQTQYLIPPPAPERERVRLEFSNFAPSWHLGRALPTPETVAIAVGAGELMAYRGAAAKRAWVRLHRVHPGEGGV